MNTALGPFASFASSCTWAVGVAHYSKLSRSYSPPTVNFNRAALTFPLFLLTSLALYGTDDLARLQSHHFIWMFVSILSSYAFGDIVFLLSTRSLGVPGALAIASSYPFWAALGGVFFKGEQLSLVNWFGLCLVVAGTVLVILSGARPFKGKRQTIKTPFFDRYWVGVFLALLTSLFWSLNFFAVSNGAHGVSPFTINTLRMGYAVLLCPLFAPLVNRIVTQKFAFTFAPKEYRRGVLIFITESYFGSVFFSYGLVHAPLGIASALSSLAPVITLPIAVFFGGEKLSLWKTLGVLTVVCGIWMLFL